jgi:CheY-like chemotaxis protein
MPGLDGIGLLQTIRKQCPKQADTPFLFLTAYSDRDRQIAARRHGADEFLNKPVEMDVLLAVVENQIRKRRASKGQHEEELVKLFRKLQQDPSAQWTEIVREPRAGVPTAVAATEHSQQERHLVGGWIKLIGLSDVKEKLGPRWDKVASTVRQLAENKIAQNLSENDTYRLIGDEVFEVCIHGGSEAETSATVRRIQQQILDGIGALALDGSSLPDIDQTDLATLGQVRAEFYPLSPSEAGNDEHGDLLEVVSAKIERAAKAFTQNSGQMLAQIVHDGEMQLVPILDHNLTSTRLAYCAFDAAASSIETRMRDAYAHDPQKMLDLDMAKLGLAIPAAIGRASQQFTSFIVSVDVNSVRTPKSRQKYLSLLGSIPHANRSQFVLLIENGLAQVHASLLTDIARSLKPFSITCWLRVTTPEPYDKSVADAMAPVVAMSYFDLENLVRTNSEKIKMFRKNLASRKILFLIDGIVDSRQQANAKKVVPNYYCFSGHES